MKFRLNKIRNAKAIFFCSSIGEYDQILPLIDDFSARGLQPAIFFFSENGFKYAEKLNHDSITFSPIDSFLFQLFVFSRIRPSLFILNRNEAWTGFLYAASLYGKVFVTNFIDRKYNISERFIIQLLLFPVKKVFTTNPVRFFSHDRFEFTGDTKTDRVRQRLLREKSQIEHLRTSYRIDGKKLLVIGNAYPGDIEKLVETLDFFPELIENWKFIVIPGRPGMYSSMAPFLQNWIQKGEVLLIPEFGTLLHFYAMSDFSWVGGGFGQGVHNVIEAIYSQKEVTCGPNLNEQPLAKEAMRLGILKTFVNKIELFSILSSFVPHRAYPLMNNSNPTELISNKILYENNHSG